MRRKARPAIRPRGSVRWGQTLDRLQLDRGAFACKLGGIDRSSLFVAAAHWPGVERFMEASPTMMPVPLRG